MRRVPFQPALPRRARRQPGTDEAERAPSCTVPRVTMAARAVSLGGVGAALSAEDVLRVARGAPCALDAAVMAKLERDVAAPSAQSVR